MTRAEVVAEVRRRLDAALDASSIPTVAPGEDGPAHDWISLHDAAEVCPARAFVPGDDFAETAATAARAIALTALGGQGASVPRTASASDRVQASMDSPEALRPSLADWLAERDVAGRAAVANAAVAWLVDAVALAHRRPPEPRWLEPRSITHKVRRHGVTLAASADAARRRGASDNPVGGGSLEVVGPHVLLIRLRPQSTDGRVSRRLALVWALSSGDVPSSIVVGHRETHTRVQLEMDEQLVDLAVAEAVEDIGHAVTPSDAPRVGGPGCRHCPLLDVCDVGPAHVEGRAAMPFPSSGSPLAGWGQLGEGADPTM